MFVCVYFYMFQEKPFLMLKNIMDTIRNVWSRLRPSPEIYPLGPESGSKVFKEVTITGGGYRKFAQNCIHTNKI